MDLENRVLLRLIVVTVATSPVLGELGLSQPTWDGLVERVGCLTVDQSEQC